MTTVEHHVSQMGAGLVVTVEVHHYKPVATNDVASRRRNKQRVRDHANATAEVMSKVLRTGAKAAGPVASSFGMSHLELHGTNA